MARKHAHTDPLDLLLDTMTNAFGAIIMIAISVSLLVNDTQEALDAPESSREQMADRKAAQEAEALAAAEQLHTQLEEKLRAVGDVAEVIEERDALKVKVTLAEAELRAEAPSASREPLKAQAAQLAGDLIALQENVARLTAKSQEMGKVSLSKQTKQTVELTPPSAVRDTSKSPYSLIFRHGQAFPLMVPGAAGMVRNDASVRWIEGGNFAEVEPVPGKGIDTEKNDAAVRDLIANLRKINAALEKGSSLYVASYVYKDSFAAYLKFKQALTNANTGLGQGWEPVGGDENLKFGATGFKPGEQN